MCWWEINWHGCVSLFQASPGCCIDIVLCWLDGCPVSGSLGTNSHETFNFVCLGEKKVFLGGGLFNALSIFMWNLESMSIFREMSVGILMNVCNFRLDMKRISTLARLILSFWSILIFANFFYLFSKAFTTKMTSCIYVSTAHVLHLLSVNFWIWHNHWLLVSIEIEMIGIVTLMGRGSIIRNNGRVSLGCHHIYILSLSHPEYPPPWHHEALPRKSFR